MAQQSSQAQAQLEKYAQRVADRLPEITGAGTHCRNRVFEWSMGGAIAGLGMLLVIWPAAIKESAFFPFLEIMSQRDIATVCLGGGILRMIALWWNGHSAIWGPLVRASGAVLGAVVLAALAFALYRQGIMIGRSPSPTLPFFLSFFVAELISASRAAGDVRLTRKP